MARKSAVSKYLIDGKVPTLGIVAKKAMLRGGRAWMIGAHAFDTPEKIAELGTPDQVAAMLETLELYPADFEIHVGGLPVEKPAETSQSQQ